jgi:hypothetical protein
MGLSLVRDVTKEYIANSNAIVVDAAGWDYLVWHVKLDSGTMSIFSSNDSGAIEGSLDGNSLTATDFYATAAVSVGSTALTTGVTTFTVSGLYKTYVAGRFVKLSGGVVATAGKVIVHYYKIS